MVKAHGAFRKMNMISNYVPWYIGNDDPPWHIENGGLPAISSGGGESV